MNIRRDSQSSTSVASYIRTQATVAAIFNVVLNPLFQWLGNREMDFVPLWGNDGVARNTAVTSVILSLLVTLFAAHGARHELQAGRVGVDGGSLRAGRLLSRLPSRAWQLGLVLGVGAALLVVVALWLLHLLGVSGLSFAGSLVFIAVYGGGLAFLVARLVILRQFADEPPPAG